MLTCKHIHLHFSDFHYPHTGNHTIHLWHLQFLKLFCWAFFGKCVLFYIFPFVLLDHGRKYRLIEHIGAFPQSWHDRYRLLLLFGRRRGWAHAWCVVDGRKLQGCNVYFFFGWGRAQTEYFPIGFAKDELFLSWEVMLRRMLVRYCFLHILLFNDLLFVLIVELLLGERLFCLFPQKSFHYLFQLCKFPPLQIDLAVILLAIGHKSFCIVAFL